jgi:histone-lysine N-methyltransferase SETMAR
LQRLNTALKKKRPALVNRKGVIVQHDNASSHSARMTLDTIETLKWETLLHPTYSPDTALSNFYLITSRSNHLRGKTLKDKNNIENELQIFFDSKTKDFDEQDIKNLVSRWSEVTTNDVVE